jgi:hypothetical protein
MTAKNYFSYLIMLYIASTLIFSIGSNIYITRILNLTLIGSFIIYILLNNSIKIHLHKFLWSYLAFAIFSLSSFYWSIDSASSINRSIIIIIISINIIMIYNICRYFKIEKFILYGILLGTIYNYFILFDIISYSSQYTVHFIHRFVGTTNNPNVLAIYMLLGIVSSILLMQNTKYIWNKLLILNIGLSLYSIIMTASKKGIIFAILLLLIYFISSIKSKKTFYWSIAIIVFIIYIVNSGLIFKIEGIERLLYRFTAASNALNSNIAGGSTYERLYLIQTAYDVFSQNFWTIFFGTGQQTFFLQNKFGLYAHNNFMEIIANLGLIGIILFYSIHYNIIKTIKTIKYNNIKLFLYGFIFVILLMDNALVSYAFKPMFFMFIFISLYSENNKKDIIYEKN